MAVVVTQQHLRSGQRSLLVTAVSVGYRPYEFRYLFEWVLLARKWGIIAVAVFYDEPLTSAVVTLAFSAVVWLAVLKWNPYIRRLAETHTRSSHVTVLSLQVGGCPCACLVPVPLLRFTCSSHSVLSALLCCCSQPLSH